MELQQGVLAVKICELAKEYGLLQSRIQICKEKNPEQLQQILEQINDECKTHRIILEQNARYGRLPACLLYTSLLFSGVDSAAAFLHISS